MKANAGMSQCEFKKTRRAKYNTEHTMHPRQPEEKCGCLSCCKYKQDEWTIARTSCAGIGANRKHGEWKGNERYDQKASF